MLWAYMVWLCTFGRPIAPVVCGEAYLTAEGELHRICETGGTVPVLREGRFLMAWRREDGFQILRWRVCILCV